MRRLTCLVAFLLLLCAAPVLATTTIRHARFRTPTGRIHCGVNIREEGRGITCFAPFLPHHQLDGYVKLNPHGRTKRGERGDDPWLPSAKTEATLHYGVRWARSGVVCTVSTAGLTCKNRDHHGFFLSVQRRRYF